MLAERLRNTYDGKTFLIYEIAERQKMRRMIANLCWLDGGSDESTGAWANEFFQLRVEEQNAVLDVFSEPRNIWRVKILKNYLIRSYGGEVNDEKS